MLSASWIRDGLQRGLGSWVAEVRPATLRADAQAGLLAAVLVLPQGIAFAALAGLPPAMGLVAAALPGALAALGGSSRHVMTGPTNALALALGAMLVTLSRGDTSLLVPLALALTLLVGLMQLTLALTRLGTLANFISPSVMLGFTSGAALLIGWYALGSIMGGDGRASPIEAWHGGLSPQSLAVGLLTLIAALAGRRWWRRGPYLLVALLLGIAACWLLTQFAQGHGAAPLRVGTPPSAWPDWQLPWAQPARLMELGSPLLQAALALTIIALGQSMAIAKAMAARSGQVLDVNRECLGQGLGNLGAAFSGGMVVCGSLNRSVPNLEAGAVTPLAAVASALILLLLVAVAGPLLAWIPLAGVGALLLVVAWSLVDRAGWASTWRLERTEFAIALTTGVATLLLHLEVAVLAGVLLSLVVYVYHSARPALRDMGFDRAGSGRSLVVVDPLQAAQQECPQLKMLRMEGSVWFGALAHVDEHLRGLCDRAAGGADRQPFLLVMAKSMNTIDLAAARLWDQERVRRRALGGDLFFHHPRPQVLSMWARSGFLKRLGEQHVFPGKRSAISAIVPMLDENVCARCSARIFAECADRPGSVAADAA